MCYFDVMASTELCITVKQLYSVIKELYCVISMIWSAESSASL